MKLQAVLLTCFLPSVFGYWNCKLPVGTGDYGLCLENGNENNALACGESNPCKVLGNGCIPLGAGTANCS
nr:uncharacterized protein CTRU02_05068 [Colletotrichum truncatum]KAF6794867.1 hypothetical protein CTRU02_05068 [Colletotrichum truncatum]